MIQEDERTKKYWVITHSFSLITKGWSEYKKCLWCKCTATTSTLGIILAGFSFILLTKFASFSLTFHEITATYESINKSNIFIFIALNHNQRISKCFVQSQKATVACGKKPWAHPGSWMQSFHWVILQSTAWPRYGLWVFTMAATHFQGLPPSLGGQVSQRGKLVAT